jgi:hypothetical protein
VTAGEERDLRAPLCETDPEASAQSAGRPDHDDPHQPDFPKLAIVVLDPLVCGLFAARIFDFDVNTNRPSRGSSHF